MVYATLLRFIVPSKWNTLPRNLKRTNKLNNFKRNLKSEDRKSFNPNQ